MDTRVKERMVGAIVLIAVALILIPELLSGPHAPEAPKNSLRDETALRSFNIDLSKHTSSEKPAPQPAPAQIAAAKPPDNLASPETPAVVEPPPQSESPAPAVASAPPPVKESPKEEQKPETEKSPAPVASRDKAPVPTAQRQAAGGWAVQIGSYAFESAAQKIAQGLKHKGYDAFVMPFKTGAKTLYRVRVGPQSQRGAAESVAAKLKADGFTGSIVPHP